MCVNANRRATRVVLAIVMVSLLAPRARALPPDPDNAALLYYQGLLSLAELDDATRDLMRDVAKGAVEPNDKVRECIDQCHSAIGFAEAAAEVPVCNWGFRFSEGFDALMPQLAPIRFLAFVLVADARVRAADGDYRGALERCLMTDTLARHVGDDTLISYLVSIAARNVGYECMADIVGQASGDVSLLKWLKNELAMTSERQLTPVRPLKIEMEIVLDVLRMEKLEKLVEVAASSDEKAKEKILATATEALLAQARQLYAERAASALNVLALSLPYAQGHAQFKQLAEDTDPNDPASFAVSVFMPAIGRVYTLATRSQAYANAMKAGVEICLKRAETGKLPAGLPAGLPKDPFSGEDFEYERTGDGFVLRCRAKERATEDKVNEYLFTVK